MAVDCSDTSALAESARCFDCLTRDQLSAAAIVLLCDWSSFDPSACEVVSDEDSGGDTFDCYEDGETEESLPNGGTNFDGVWLIGDGTLNQPLGDDFEEYPDGAAGVMTGGDGLAGQWEHGDGP